jgi:hypothetical protein
VTDADGKSQPGLRFYSKRGVHRQTTEVRTTWKEATLSLAIHQQGADPKLGPLVRQLSTTAAVNSRNAALIARTKRSLADSSSSAAAVFSAFAAGAGGEPEPELLRVENSIETATVIDYSAPQYLSIEAPVFGTATFKPELNSDGTLTKLEASVTSTPERIAELIPVGELLTSVLGLTGAEVQALGAVPEGSMLAVMTLTIEDKGWRDVWTYDWSLDQSPLTRRPGARLVPLDEACVGASHRRLPLVSSKPAQKSDDAITFSGSVQLPEKKP